MALLQFSAIIGAVCSAAFRLLCVLATLLATLPGSAASPLSLPADPLQGQLLPDWAASSEPSLPPPGVIEPALARVLSETPADEMVRVILVLRRQVDLQHATLSATGQDDARVRLVESLQTLAERDQEPIRAYLDGARAADLVESYTSLWIFNGLAARVRSAFVQDLAAHPSVAVVRLDRYRRWVSGAPPVTVRSPQRAGPEWNLGLIRAPEVWSSLEVSGTGAVVAGMDTGVDWLHPALSANYRGFNPHGTHTHVGNWFDAVEGSLYPTDGHGHGTHTIGVAVGQGGVGVAPGARWIAVRVLSSNGYGFDSWIHAGFQWLLAPGGDPARAPDVVNCSWSNENGYLTLFQDDLRVLRAAGILAVFAVGNNGPLEGTVNSPASLPEAFAVGATDEYDVVATFSSRGPSPWGEIRPHVGAPGVYVRSALPGGLYGTSNGTSMAVPHVVGLVALLRSVSPTLSVTDTVLLITSTAVPLGAPLPNNDTGWGRVDAFAAVAVLTRPGFMAGVVTRTGDGTPVAGAAVSAVSRTGGRGSTTTDGTGAYWMALAPDWYDVGAGAFGYLTGTVSGIAVVTGATTVQDFALVALPSGLLRGRVTDLATGAAVSATVTVFDTPLVSSGSSYSFTLPAGNYFVQARSLGHRVVTATVTVTASQVTTADLALPPAPSILLVDSGGWYYASQIRYYREALDDLALAYDEWSIRHLPDDLPQVSDFAPYSVVIWSAPWDGPGYIGAQDAVTGYLSAGGRLLLSGQDVGFVDGGGLLNYSQYYREYLRVSLVEDSSGVWTLQALPDDLFSGLTLEIAGPGGADNQAYPDVVAVADPDSAAPVLTYDGAGCAGVRVGTCLGYRVVYLAFGFEGISDRALRREVMDRALAWLVAEPPALGLEVTPTAQTRVGPPGTVVTHAVRVRHLGQSGVPDRFALVLEGAAWPTEIQASSLALAPCTSATVLVSVTIPADARWDARDVVTLTVRSTTVPTLTQSVLLTSKAPAPLLLVDDDRWFEQQEVYWSAVSGAGIPFDTWQTCPALGPCVDESPPLEVLRWYPIVVWWTGYDWFRPVTADEEATLTAYLEGGGRLFLSSQDFLYYHHRSHLSRDYLGVLAYTEDVTPTSALGVPHDPIGDGLGPWALHYPEGYRNWSDGMDPTPGTAVVLRDQRDLGLAVARRGPSHAAVFFGFPFEALPLTARSTTVERIAGWLSWLGGSSFVADREAAVPGATTVYSLSLHNDGPVAVTVMMSNTLPTDLALLPGTLTGPAWYDPGARRLWWEGSIGAGETVTVTYQADLSAELPAGTVVSNVVGLSIPGQSIRFRRAAVVRVGTPDLSLSGLSCAPYLARPGAMVTCTLHVVNAGPGDAASAVGSVVLPADATFVAGSLLLEGSGTLDVLGGRVHWTGPVAASERITASWRLQLPVDPVHPPLYSAAFLDDGAGGRWERPAWVVPDPYRAFVVMVASGWLPVQRRVFLPAVSSW